MKILLYRVTGCVTVPFQGCASIAIHHGSCFYLSVLLLSTISLVSLREVCRGHLKCGIQSITWLDDDDEDDDDDDDDMGFKAARHPRHIGASVS